MVFSALRCTAGWCPQPPRGRIVVDGLQQGVPQPGGPLECEDLHYGQGFAAREQTIVGMDARGFPVGDLRVSDAERDRAVAELSAAYQAGRITADEFGGRSTQAWNARTGKELTATLADLPLDLSPVETGPADIATRRRDDNYLVPRLTVAASLTAICFASVAVTSASQPGVDWTGALTPAAVSVLCAILVILLHVRARRAAR